MRESAARSADAAILIMGTTRQHVKEDVDKLVEMWRRVKNVQPDELLPILLVMNAWDTPTTEWLIQEPDFQFMSEKYNSTFKLVAVRRAVGLLSFRLATLAVPYIRICTHRNEGTFDAAVACIDQYVRSLESKR